MEALPPYLNTKNDISCLDRWQKEKIEICFRENEACHLKIEEMTTPPPAPQSTSIWISALLGFVGGMIVNQQLHH